MTYEDEQCLRLGRMVVAMIRDVLSTPRKDEALASRTITTRDGGEARLMICKDQQTVTDLEAVVAKRTDMIKVHMKEPGVHGELG